MPHRAASTARRNLRSLSRRAVWAAVGLAGLDHQHQRQQRDRWPGARTRRTTLVARSRPWAVIERRVPERRPPRSSRPRGCGPPPARQAGPARAVPSRSGFADWRRPEVEPGSSPKRGLRIQRRGRAGRQHRGPAPSPASARAPAPSGRSRSPRIGAASTSWPPSAQRCAPANSQAPAPRHRQTQPGSGPLCARTRAAWRRPAAAAAIAARVGRPSPARAHERRRPGRREPRSAGPQPAGSGAAAPATAASLRPRRTDPPPAPASRSAATWAPAIASGLAKPPGCGRRSARYRRPAAAGPKARPRAAPARRRRRAPASACPPVRRAVPPPFGARLDKPAILPRFSLWNLKRADSSVSPEWRGATPLASWGESTARPGRRQAVRPPAPWRPVPPRCWTGRAERRSASAAPSSGRPGRNGSGHGRRAGPPGAPPASG